MPPAPLVFMNSLTAKCEEKGNKKPRKIGVLLLSLVVKTDTGNRSEEQKFP